MRKSRKTLYRSGSRKEKRSSKVAIGFTVLLGIFWAWKSVRIAPNLVLGIIGGVVLCVGCFFLGYAIVTRGVTIFEDGLIIPTAATSLRPRTFIPFSQISEIRLNTGAREFSMDIEIRAIHGKVEKLSKAWLTNWDEFYRVLTEDLKGRIRVVE